MISFGKAIVFSFIMIIFGIFIGQLEKRNLQKTKCPYCSCREHCKIGKNVKANISSEESERPLACYER